MFADFEKENRDLIIQVLDLIKYRLFKAGYISKNSEYITYEHLLIFFYNNSNYESLLQ